MYKERIITWWTILLILPVLIVIAVPDRPPLIFTLIFSSAMVLLAINFYQLKIEINNNQISFGYGIIKKTFDIKEVESCEVHTAKFKTYWGYGIRWGWDGTVGYLVRMGKSVKIKVYK